MIVAVLHTCIPPIPTHADQYIPTYNTHMHTSTIHKYTHVQSHTHTPIHSPTQYKQVLMLHHLKPGAVLVL